MAIEVACPIRLLVTSVTTNKSCPRAIWSIQLALIWYDFTIQAWRKLIRDTHVPITPKTFKLAEAKIIVKHDATVFYLVVFDDVYPQSIFHVLKQQTPT